MEWLTQSLPDVCATLKNLAWGQTIWLPACALLYSAPDCRRRDLFIFSLHHTHTHRTFPEVRRPEKNERSTSLARGWIISLLQRADEQQFCDERAENWRSLAIADAHQSHSLGARAQPPSCNYLRRILLSRSSRDATS